MLTNHWEPYGLHLERPCFQHSEVLDMNLGDTIQPPAGLCVRPKTALPVNAASGACTRACRAAILVSQGPGDSPALASLTPGMLFRPPQPASEGPAPQLHGHTSGPFSGPTPAHPLLPFLPHKPRPQTCLPKPSLFSGSPTQGGSCGHHGGWWPRALEPPTPPALSSPVQP